ncbi:MAG: amino acid ABC transporter substrate-binding protein [Thermoflexales bacterium]|nr:amino acid ABC transporter substrate-binding protein [Thermoflexales bacterium]
MQTGGAIRFGVDSNDWPFAAVDAEGQFVGLNPDLGRTLAERIGVKVEFVPVGYDGAYDALYVGRCDSLIGVVENDPARLANFIYTGAYFDAGQVVITRCGEASNSERTAARSADWGGKRIAVELGSEADAAARHVARRTPEVTLLSYDSPGEALEALKNGQADVALAEAVWARRAVAGQTALRILPETVQPYPLALATRADSPRLRTALSRALAQLEKEGKLEAIVSRWLEEP